MRLSTLSACLPRLAWPSRTLGNGLVAAVSAGAPVLITRSLYFRDEDFTGAAWVTNDLTDLPDDFWFGSGL